MKSAACQKAHAKKAACQRSTSYVTYSDSFLVLLSTLMELPAYFVICNPALALGTKLAGLRLPILRHCDLNFSFSTLTDVVKLRRI